MPTARAPSGTGPDLLGEPCGLGWCLLDLGRKPQFALRAPLRLMPTCTCWHAPATHPRPGRTRAQDPQAGCPVARTPFTAAPARALPHRTAPATCLRARTRTLLLPLHARAHAALYAPLCTPLRRLPPPACLPHHACRTPHAHIPHGLDDIYTTTWFVHTHLLVRTSQFS